MTSWIYRKRDGLFIKPVRPALDETVYSVADLTRAPDPRTERVDLSADPPGIRTATAQEIIEYDAQRADAEAAADLDSQKALKVLALLVRQYCNQLRLGVYQGAGPGGTKSIADVLADTISIWKALP